MVYRSVVKCLLCLEKQTLRYKGLGSSQFLNTFAFFVDLSLLYKTIKQTAMFM